MSFYDILLAKKLGGGGGSSVTVEPLSVTQNGTYSETGKAYSPVSVSVPNSYSASDEGKVVSSGALVSQTSQTIDSNGTYDTTLKNSVTVNVSGGGSFTPMFAAIRPDAEIAYSFQYDKLAVQDLGVTIPAYQNSYVQLLSNTKVMDGVVIDVDNYDYYICASALLYPIKSEQVRAIGSFQYHFMNAVYNLVYVPTNKLKSFDGVVSDGSTYGELLSQNAYGGNVYCTSPTALSASMTSSTSATSSGIYTNGFSVSFSKNSKKLNITAFGARMTGNAAQLDANDWGRIIDVRIQYKINVYRVPRSGNRLDGWSINMGLENALASIANGGTLQ